MARRRTPLLALLLLPPAVASSQIPVGGEFRANTYTTSHQRLSRVAWDPAGGFVIAWGGANGQDGDQYGAFARRYDAAGTPLGATELQVNSYTVSSQTRPMTAFDASGRFVIVWESTGQDGAHFGIFGQRFDAAGAALGPEFRVNAYTTFAQRVASVGSADDGAFVVAWTDYAQEGSTTTVGVFGRRFDASGAAQGDDFRVNVYTTADQKAPAIAVSPDGSFMVVWESTGQDGSGRGVFGRRYDTSGSAIGIDFRVNEYTTGDQMAAHIASDADGNAVVVWSSVGQHGAGTTSVMGRRYAGGAPQGGEFVVNATAGNNYDGSVALDADGHFVVAWVRDAGPFPVLMDIFARRFDGAGPLGDEFRASAFSSATQVDPSVAAAPNGDFVVSWAATNQDGSGDGVFAQRFRPEAIFRDDFESGALNAWSVITTDGGDLAVSAAAAMRGTATGLQAVVDDTAGLHVQDDRPQDEKRYRARFYLDPNGFDPGESLNHRRTRTLIAFSEGPTRRVAAVVLRRLGGEYSLMARARLDDNSQANTPFAPISDGPHAVEIDLACASGPEAFDGSLGVWIDGIPVALIDTLDNSLCEVDFARLGALSVKAGASGTLYFDEFDSRRLFPVGP